MCCGLENNRINQRENYFNYARNHLSYTDCFAFNFVHISIPYSLISLLEIIEILSNKTMEKEEDTHHLFARFQLSNRFHKICQSQFSLKLHIPLNSELRFTNALKFVLFEFQVCSVQSRNFNFCCLPLPYEHFVQIFRIVNGCSRANFVIPHYEFIIVSNL